MTTLDLINMMLSGFSRFKFQTVIINRLMMVGYTIGIDPGTLGRFYYG